MTPCIDKPLSQLVSDLTEGYQPIFGHPELSASATRTCEARLASIVPIYRALASELKRPLRVLDLGCAQGFFSFNLAQLGASVVGIDLQEANLTVCQTVAKEHPKLSIQFRREMIEEIALQIKPGQYDLVLGLDVFHHLVQIVGLPITQEIISVFAQATMAGIYEVALPDEQTARAAAHFQNPRDVLAKYAFVHQVARHPAHLHGKSQPLYYASNYYWFLNDQAQRFYTWRKESHEYSKNSCKGTRRYFFGDDHIVKLFQLDGEFKDINSREHLNETGFLTKPPENFEVPRLLLHGRHQDETWVVRELLPGDLLLDVIGAKRSYDADVVMRDVLAQLSILESCGLYHNDLRVWNILLGPDGHALVIDYGALTKEKKDRGWPYDIFLSFMIFMHDVLNKTATISNPIRSDSFDPDMFPEPYRSMLWAFYEHDPAEWSFSLMNDLFLSPASQNIDPDMKKASFSAVFKVMKNACAIHQSASVYWLGQLKQMQSEKKTHEHLN